MLPPVGPPPRPVLPKAPPRSLASEVFDVAQREAVTSLKSPVVMVKKSRPVLEERRPKTVTDERVSELESQTSRLERVASAINSQLSAEHSDSAENDSSEGLVYPKSAIRSQVEKLQQKAKALVESLDPTTSGKRELDRQERIHQNMMRNLWTGNQELEANHRSLINLQSVLQEQAEVVLRQKEEIVNLQGMLADVRKQKALSAPVILTTAPPAKLLSTDEILRPVSQPDPAPPERPTQPDNLALRQMAILEEQGRLMKDLLRGLDSETLRPPRYEVTPDPSVFYQAVVDHTVLVGSELPKKTDVDDVTSQFGVVDFGDVPPGFSTRLLVVRRSNLLVHELNPVDNAPGAILFTLVPDDTRGSVNMSGTVLVLQILGIGGRLEELHVIVFRSRDSANRWRMALTYGGFLEATQRAESSVGTPRPTWPFAVVVSGAGVKVDGHTTLPARNPNSLVAWNYPTNTMHLAVDSTARRWLEGLPGPNGSLDGMRSDMSFNVRVADCRIDTETRQALITVYQHDRVSITDPDDRTNVYTLMNMRHQSWCLLVTAMISLRWNEIRISSVPVPSMPAEQPEILVLHRVQDMFQVNGDFILVTNQEGGTVATVPRRSSEWVVFPETLHMQANVDEDYPGHHVLFFLFPSPQIYNDRLGSMRDLEYRFSNNEAIRGACVMVMADVMEVFDDYDPRDRLQPIHAFAKEDLIGLEVGSRHVVILFNDADDVRELAFELGRPEERERWRSALDLTKFAESEPPAFDSYLQAVGFLAPLAREVESPVTHSLGWYLVWGDGKEIYRFWVDTSATLWLDSDRGMRLVSMRDKFFESLTFRNMPFDSYRALKRELVKVPHPDARTILPHDPQCYLCFAEAEGFGFAVDEEELRSGAYMAWFPRIIYTADILDKNRIFLRKRRADEGLPEAMQHIAVPVVEIKGRSSSQTTQWRFAMLISGLRYPADRFLWPRFLFCFDLETAGVSEESLEELYRLNRTEESMRRRRPAQIDRPADSARGRKSSSSSAPAAKPPAAKPPAAKPPAAKPPAAKRPAGKRPAAKRLAAKPPPAKPPAGKPPAPKPPAGKPALETKPPAGKPALETKPRALREKPPAFMRLGQQPPSPINKKALPSVKKSVPPKKPHLSTPDKKPYKKKVMAAGMGKLPPSPKKRRAKEDGGSQPAKPVPERKTGRSSVDRTPEKSLPLRGGTTPVPQERKPGRQGSFTRMLEQQTWFAPENKMVSEEAEAEPQESAQVSSNRSDASFVLDPSPDETIMLVNPPSSSTSVPVKKPSPSGGAFQGTMDELNERSDEDLSGSAARRWFGKKRKHGRHAPESARPSPSPSWFGRIRHRKRREYVVGFLWIFRRFAKSMCPWPRLLYGISDILEVDCLKLSACQNEGCDWLDLLDTPHERQPVVQRVLVLLVDGLRFDSIQWQQYPMHQHQNQMPFVKLTATTNPDRARVLRFVADAPTATTERLQAMLSGIYPSFLGMLQSLHSGRLALDNVVTQLKRAGRPVFFVGDNTWEKLFGDDLHADSQPLESLDIFDLDSTDDAVWASLEDFVSGRWTREIVRASRLTVFHTLGVDHAGHVDKVDSPVMARKIAYHDAMVRLALQGLEDMDNSIFLLISDHGMTMTGSHGGATRDELDAAFFIMSPFDLQEGPGTIDQVDLLPTISFLLGVPTPINAVGVPLTFMIPPEHHLSALRSHFWHLERLRSELSMETELSSTLRARCLNSLVTHKILGCEEYFQEFKQHARHIQTATVPAMAYLMSFLMLGLGLLCPSFL